MYLVRRDEDDKHMLHWLFINMCFYFPNAVPDKVPLCLVNNGFTIWKGKIQMKWNSNTEHDLGVMEQNIK